MSITKTLRIDFFSIAPMLEPKLMKLVSDTDVDYVFETMLQLMRQFGTLSEGIQSIKTTPTIIHLEKM